jgi:hypothetical protein
MFDEATQDNNDFPSTMEYNVPNNLLGTLVAADEVQAAVGHEVGRQRTVSGQQQQAGAVGDHDRGAQQGAAHASRGGADVSASQERQQVSAPEVNADEDDDEDDDDEMVDADQVSECLTQGRQAGSIPEGLGASCRCCTRKELRH